MHVFDLFSRSVLSHSVVSNSLLPHGLMTVADQAPLSMEFPNKNIGVGCDFLLQGIVQPRDQIHFSCIGRPDIFYP